ncbi:MAG: hypothetical protein M3295_04180 [Chloroflexota bacterium]|nr:hypothetical protein [Chloroflexota bacterium]
MPDNAKNAENSAGQSGPETDRAGRRGPLQQGGEGRGGALTGETGVFTTDGDPESVEPFVPAETREYSDPVLRGHVTEASKLASDAHRRRVEEAADADAGQGLGEGADASITGAGQLATERASGLTGLLGQNHAMGASTSAQAGTQQGSGATELASREGGYGGSHGLDPNDPAYRMDDRTVGEESPDS